MKSVPLKELEAESAEMQPAMLIQFFVSLPRLGGGWCANHALQGPAWRRGMEARNWSWRCVDA